MPTNYSDQFFDIDPANPPPVGTLLTVSVRTLTDQNDDGDIDRFNGDSIDGIDIVNSWPGDTITINVAGVGNITYTGITFYLPGGVRVFTPTDGQVLQEGTLVSTSWVNSQGPLLVDDLGPPCFAEGTMIDTDKGEVQIQFLSVGDRVATRDHGLQAIRWIGGRSLTAAELSANPKLRPVRIAAGSLSPRVPSVDLVVSPQHRILVRSPIAERMFGATEIQVAAKHLLSLNGVDLAEDLDGVTYWHILFDRHEIVMSNGAETESLFAGEMAMRSLTREDLLEIFTLFPELQDQKGTPAPVRPFVAGRLGRKLAWRHARNGKPLTVHQS